MKLNASAASAGAGAAAAAADDDDDDDCEDAVTADAAAIDTFNDANDK
jgi:hypothetical protein